ncbi:3-dehydroquinate dehydratase [Ruminococcaceae bacterium OttesenSCG-928-A16]|nr:3-dehydroquinate dehydratase [Ruminococcaceae bacterium OttesenSCG-928-A16]
MNFLIINGPNINMLGLRQPEIYGTDTYNDLVALVTDTCEQHGITPEFFQSNHEGAIVDEIQLAYGKFDGIIINPAAFTHTSVAILDALQTVSIPTAEVHISDITQREEFRQISFAGLACQLHFIGQGLQGYANAVVELKEYIEQL